MIKREKHFRYKISDEEFKSITNEFRELLLELSEKTGIKININEKTNCIQFNLNTNSYTLVTNYFPIQDLQQDNNHIVIQKNSRIEIYQEIKKIISINKEDLLHSNIDKTLPKTTDVNLINNFSPDQNEQETEEKKFRLLVINDQIKAFNRNINNLTKEIYKAENQKNDILYIYTKIQILLEFIDLYKTWVLEIS